MKIDRKWSRTSIAVGALVLVGTAGASPWPIEAAIAYVEELQSACAKAQPEGKTAFQARKELLYSESPDRVRQAMTSENYFQARTWARDAIAHRNAADLTDECSAFLTHSDLALNQTYPRLEKPEPTN